MRVLFDNGTPRGIGAALTDHIVEEARAHEWDTLRNGELLDAAGHGLLSRRVGGTGAGGRR